MGLDRNFRGKVTSFVPIHQLKGVALAATQDTSYFRVAVTPGLHLPSLLTLDLGWGFLPQAQVGTGLLFRRRLTEFLSGLILTATSPNIRLSSE